MTDGEHSRNHAQFKAKRVFERDAHFEAFLKSKYRLVEGEIIGPMGVPIKGHPLPAGYRTTTVFYEGVRRRLSIHRFVFFLANGYFPVTVDHINGDVSDNRPENLRAASMLQQHINKGKNKSRDLPRGVRYHPKATRRPFEARFGKTTIGYFKTAEEASAAWAARARSYGDFLRK